MAEVAESGEGVKRERRNRDGEMMTAALKLFASKGYTAASVQDIADAIGVLKSSVYHYIGSKEELLFRIFLEAHEENEALMLEVEALDVSPVDRLRDYLNRTLLVALNNIERTGLYFRDWRHLTGTRRETLIRHRVQYGVFLRGLIEAAYAAEGVTAHITLKHVSSFIIGATNWLAEWYRPGGSDSPELIASDYAELAMTAIMGTAHAAKPANSRARRQSAI
ncbi:TetR/AcrR family transcriptional regulator [Sphingomonas oryzagri]